MTTIRNFKASFDEGTEFYRDLLKTEIDSVTEKIKPGHQESLDQCLLELMKV